MTKEEFREFTRKGIVIMDGATGSMLQKNGMPKGVCPELWISEHPSVIKEIQKAYIKSGARIIYTPTFTGSRPKLKYYCLDGALRELNSTLAGISREAVKDCAKELPEGEKVYLAADISMTGRTLKPAGDMDFEELIDIYKEQIGVLSAAGVDLVVVETMVSLSETRAAVIAAKEVCPKLPVMATMSFEADGKSLYGTDPVTALITLQALGVDAFGMNCSVGPSLMVPHIKRMVKLSNIPIICKPNAGLPSLDENGNTVYDLDPESFAAELAQAAKAGASILGGCCGTTPEHIACLGEKIKDLKPVIPEENEKYCLSGERSSITFDLSSPFMVIGERINPTGKKALQEALRQQDLSLATAFAEEQEENGAALLDINMGMSGVDEGELMLRAIEEVTGVSSLPLVIDTSHVDIMEKALRVYPGRALINSISLENAKCLPMLKLAKKYGAAFILLPLSDSGLPKTLEEKHENIRKLLDLALKEGLNKRDIIVDGLVGTVGANPNAARETIATVRYCREELGLATACGLSNISFGLPERSIINASFLTMLLEAGLTMAIANPSQETLKDAIASASLLANRPGADLAYIERFSDRTEKKAGNKEVPAAGEASDEKSRVLKEITEGVVKGNRKGIAKLIEDSVKLFDTPRDILDKALLPAITRVGELYEEGRYFLPQLIAGGETMTKAVEALVPYLKGDDSKEDRITVIIATVKGDIHDIGKNLVSMMLKNNGFKVIDLGKDVPREEIIGRAIEEKADIVALSALMTTTMMEMKSVIEYGRSRGISVKYMIGGAVITPEYAKEIGAYYSSDAADAVRVAREIERVIGEEK